MSQKTNMLNIISETRNHYVAQDEPFGWDKCEQICVYIDGHTGARCAVGRFLKNAWKRDWQECSARDLVEMDALTVNAPVHFWSDLQSIHDHCAERECGTANFDNDARERMSEQLDRLAKRVLAGGYDLSQ